MKISQNGINLIKYFEGFRATGYFCSAGILTIGYGHAIKPFEKFKVLTPEQAEVILKKDVEIAENAILKTINVPLNQNQFDALVSFVFNIGGGTPWQMSTLRKYVNGQHHTLAADQFPRWCKAGGKRVEGLYRRRLSEKALYLGQDWYKIAVGA